MVVARSYEPITLPLLLSNTSGFATLVQLAGRGLYMTGGWRGGVDVVKHKK